MLFLVGFFAVFSHVLPVVAVVVVVVVVVVAIASADVGVVIENHSPCIYVPCGGGIGGITGGITGGVGGPS